MENNTPQSPVRYEVPAIALKALLLDTIFHMKTGAHIHRAQMMSKRNTCAMLGISPRISSKQFLLVLRDVYAQNGILEEFTQTCARHRVVVE